MGNPKDYNLLNTVMTKMTREFLQEAGANIFLSWAIRLAGGELRMKVADVAKATARGDVCPVIRAEYDKETDEFVFSVIDTGEEPHQLFADRFELEGGNSDDTSH